MYRMAGRRHPSNFRPGSLLPLPYTCPRTDMPSTTRNDDDAGRRRRKDSDKTRTSSSTKSKSSSSVHLGVKTRRSPSRERDRASPRVVSSSTGRGTPKKVGIVVPEMERRSSSGEVRPRSSYPTFSKAHSREAVGNREEIPNPNDFSQVSQTSPTSSDKQKRRSSMPLRKDGESTLSTGVAEMNRSGSAGSVRKPANGVEGSVGSGQTDSTPRVSRPRRPASHSSLRRDATFRESEVSSMPGAFPDEERKSTPTSGFHRTMSTGGSQPASSVTDGTTDSDATSIAAKYSSKRPPNIDLSRNASPPSTTDSQPKTPTADDRVYPHHPKPQVIDVERSRTYFPRGLDSGRHDPVTPKTANYMPQGQQPPHPPPPPPPAVSTGQNVPRVDYLLKNGGLTTLIPRRLVQSTPSILQYSTYESPSLSLPAPSEEYSKIFSGINKRLDEYMHVFQQNGSLAVATGYKSVARRLLDKLSQVFARDISSQRCDCVMCRCTPQPSLSDEEDSGVSWGEILEFVSGRRELPQWPPFAIAPDDTGLGLSGTRIAPMQKLDIDVPEEYRDHYLRQNQKTKKAVRNWLAQQPEYPSGPPDEADEDTLMFAMMTKLDMEQRNFFIALMHGQTAVSQSRAPTPAERPSIASQALLRARQALQRLYRLDRAPRDCESAMYLLKNPHLHGMLATLAEVNEQEWDILVSGRFDGFLWSGAEAPFPPSISQLNSPAPSRGPSRGPTATPLSRNTTPFSGVSGFGGPSRNTTPFSPLRNVTSNGNGIGDNVFPTRGQTPGLGVAPPAPVQLDEDTEIAVLAEVERNLFTDMERYEDAFEALHSRVEHVRQLLRERSAGLAMQAQLRRGSNVSDIGIRLDTPASGVTNFAEDEEADDDGLADLASLAPDDSASQVSTNHRPRPRRERRTPAPIGEEDESLFEEDVRRPSHGGRRSKY